MGSPGRAGVALIVPRERRGGRGGINVSLASPSLTRRRVGWDGPEPGEAGAGSGDSSRTVHCARRRNTKRRTLRLPEAFPFSFSFGCAVSSVVFSRLLRSSEGTLPSVRTASSPAAPVPAAEERGGACVPNRGGQGGHTRRQAAFSLFLSNCSEWGATHVT